MSLGLGPVAGAAPTQCCVQWGLGARSGLYTSIYTTTSLLAARAPSSIAWDSCPHSSVLVNLKNSFVLQKGKAGARSLVPSVKTHFGITAAPKCELGAGRKGKSWLVEVVLMTTTVFWGEAGSVRALR